jgi:hypothetical protein
MRFLDSMSAGWNISLFHYRNHGADYGRVLVGMQVPPSARSNSNVFSTGWAIPTWTNPRIRRIDVPRPIGPFLRPARGIEVPRRGTSGGENLQECCVFRFFALPRRFRQALCSSQFAWTVADLNTTSAGARSRRATVAGGSVLVADQTPLQGVKVMVIDDSNTIRRSAEIFLLQAGCTSYWRRTGSTRWRRSPITSRTSCSSTS